MQAPCLGSQIVHDNDRELDMRIGEPCPNATTSTCAHHAMSRYSVRQSSAIFS